jgi:hypothetical protein
MIEDDVGSDGIAAPSSGSLMVNRMYYASKVLTKEEATEETIEVRKPAVGIPLAQVSVGGSMTVNMGNFESVKLYVGVTLPCYVEEVDSCYSVAKLFVDKHLNLEIAALRDHRDSKK